MENNNYDLSGFDKVLADVAEIQEKGNFIPDCSTKDGYEASKRLVLDVTMPARKALEEAHKVTKKPFWDACKFLDSKKKELMPILEAVEAPHKEAYKAVDEEKKRRKAEKEARIQKGFDDINFIVQSALGKSSDEISVLLSDVTDFDVDPEVYGSRVEELISLQQSVVSQLTDAYSQRLQFEEMERQQEELKARQEAIEAKEREQHRIKEEAERVEREAKIAKEAKELAEKKAIEEAEILKEKSRVALEQAEEKAKQDAIDAENRRLADIEATKQAEIKRQQEQLRLEKEEAEKREANKRYKGKVHRAILNVLTESGISEDDAKTMIKLAAKGQLPQLTINY